MIDNVLDWRTCVCAFVCTTVAAAAINVRLILKPLKLESILVV